MLSLRHKISLTYLHDDHKHVNYLSKLSAVLANERNTLANRSPLNRDLMPSSAFSCSAVLGLLRFLRFWILPPLSKKAAMTNQAKVELAKLTKFCDT